MQGLANRVFAREAVNVVVMVAGLPVRVKAEPVGGEFPIALQVLKELAVL